MPLALLLIGAALLISVIRNTHKQLGTQLAQDFTGSGGFIVWIAAIALIGMIGYIPGWEKPSRLFLALVLLALMLSNRGFFAQFQSAITSTSIQSGNQAQRDQAAGDLPLQGPVPVQITGGSGGNPLQSAGAIGGIVSTVAGVL